jgi:adenosylcobyric acid synthase
MSSRLYRTEDGIIALAQAVQAYAARVKPSVYMNPILLKPLGDYRSSVILLGKEYDIMHAEEYYKYFVLKKGLRVVLDAYKRLAEEYDMIVIEGAGSPAEINISRYDIANMRLAERINAPVLIVSDIERGGCFASMLGTLQLLKNHERELVKGFIINKFRGDTRILHRAVERFESISSKMVLGIVPYIKGLNIPEEDSLSGDTIDKSITDESIDMLADIVKRSIDMEKIRGLVTGN